MMDENTRSIKAIDKNSVHKICSGQVVLNLATAVKELVENSLDAGATNIEVRLKNFGLDLIEVSDNGSGVDEENFAALTLKYHTSKLEEFSDLLGVESFGFRGEALSSLCALSDLVVTTKHSTAECATKIEYDYKGNIKNKTPCSRTKGTTVTLSNLFSTLPVRQKEFQKNHKREFMKMTQLLYAYCLISTGVKIICTNQTKAGQKTVVVATQGSDSYRDNLACVFGAKQLQSLLEITPFYKSTIADNIWKGLNLSSELLNTENVEIEDKDLDLSEDSNNADDNQNTSQSSTKSQGHINDSCPVKFTGYISSCAHGSGRSSTDRQFYYINSRPCEPTKLIKLVNQMYKQFNPNQYPFVFLNIILPRDNVDVNVTPDKRKVFMTAEKTVLQIVGSSLTNLYDCIPSTIQIEKPESKIEVTVKPETNQPRLFDAFLQRFASKLTKSKSVQEPKRNTFDSNNKRKSNSMLDFVETKKNKIDNSYSIDNKHSIDCVLPENEAIDMKCTNDDLDNHQSFTLENNINIKDEIVESNLEHRVNLENSVNSNTDTTENKEVISDANFDVKVENKPDNKEIMYLNFTDKMPDTQIVQLNDESIQMNTIYCKTKRKVECIADTPIPKLKKQSPKKRIVETDNDIIGKSKKNSIVMKTSLEHIKALMQLKEKGNIQERKIDKVKFKTEINPVFNKKCEEELSKEISKESFKKMEVLGQFNLGFIVTRLEDDLFIIDQHATDEIYNFETLQKTTELTTQKLVIPQKLELTGVNEQILIDNLETFKKNGFTFEIDESAEPTKRVKLQSIPMSKNWTFGKDDIEEMLFMMREDSYEFCRPSRVRAMFASRACRKSVMIGTALSKGDMRQLVDHMAEIDKPWNCPHGRPTIRHLVNMAMVSTKTNKSEP